MADECHYVTYRPTDLEIKPKVVRTRMTSTYHIWTVFDTINCRLFFCIEGPTWLSGKVFDS